MDKERVLEVDESRKVEGVLKEGEGLGEETSRGWVRTRETRGKEKGERIRGHCEGDRGKQNRKRVFGRNTKHI